MRIFFIVLLLCLPFAAHAQESFIRINEVLPNPSGDDDEKEFVELYNAGTAPVTLTNWTLSDASGKSTFVFDDVTIEDGAFIVLYKKTNFSFSLNNTGDSLVLHDDNAVVRAEMSYDRAREDFSWNYDDVWYEGTPTPGEENASQELVEESDDETDTEINGEEDEKNDTPTKETEKSYPPLRLNEVFPNPEDNEENEYIELFNPTDSPIDLTGWTLRDGSKSGKHVFDEGSTEGHGYFVIERSSFGFALNNTGTETVSLFDPNETLRDTLTYDAAAEGAVYAWDGSAWRWSPERTPGSKNIFLPAPDIDLDIPKKVYRDVPTSFFVSVDGVDESDFTVRWDFGDGRATSTKKQASHTYTKKGDFTGTLTVDTGSEKIIEEFDIDVKKHPQRKIDISALLPNPSGVDTGVEWIDIVNNDKKKVSLLGWYVASGSHPSSVTRHRINEDITLKSGESLRLTREHAAFTLPNTAGAVELRHPDDSVATEIAYKKDEGIKEDEVYKKIGEQWQWIAPPKDDDAESGSTVDETAAAIIAQALLNERSLGELSKTDGIVAGAQISKDTPPQIIVKKRWYDSALDFFGMVIGYIFE